MAESREIQTTPTTSTGIKSYIISVLIGLDVLLASIMFGTRYETISEVAGLAARDGETWGRVVCTLLDLAEKDHCERVLTLGKKGSNQ